MTWKGAEEGYGRPRPSKKATSARHEVRRRTVPVMRSGSSERLCSTYPCVALVCVPRCVL